MAGAWVNLLRLAVWLVVLTAVFTPLERMLSRQAATKREDRATDVVLYFLNNVLPQFLLSIPLGVLAWAAQRCLSQGWMEGVAALPAAVRLVVAVVIGEIGSYWGHRLMHEIPFLWRFHAVHHEPEQVDWLVNTHAHPLDVAFTRLCGLVPLYLTGLAQPFGGADLLPLLFTLIGSVWSFFIHANIRVRLGWLEHAVSTPAFHHWHHAHGCGVSQEKNYSALLPFVDRLFGTLHLPAREWPAGYGTGAPGSRGLVEAMLRPFRA